MKYLTELNFVPPNPHFKILDNKIILSQSKYLNITTNNGGDDTNDDIFDVIYFIPKNITTIIINNISNDYNK